jgi:cytochrome c biogenesis protein CcmG, thiol:disulfide interchange protein DsbE
MNRRNTRNDDVICLICDLWWLWLIIFLLIIGAILTRNYWLPLFGLGQPGVVSPLPTAVFPIATVIPSQATNPVASPSATRTTPIPTATNAFGQASSEPVAVGAQAPNFSLPRLDGGNVSLSDRGSHPALVMFFASFDSYSQAEAPTLRQIAQSYGDQLAILAINIAYNDPAEDVNRFVSDYDWAFPIALDETGSAMALYEQNSIPAHIFIDSNGIIVAIEGALTADQLKEQVSELMSQ